MNQQTRAQVAKALRVAAHRLAASPTPQKLSQKEMLDKAKQHAADRDMVFMELMRGPNPLTPEEIEALATKFPERWGRYRRFAKQADTTDVSMDEPTDDLAAG